MKYTILITTLFFCFGDTIQSQVRFMDSTYSWTEVLFSGFNGEALTRTYTFDTIPILQNGKTYFEILSSYLEGGGNWHNTGILLRQDGSKIYQWDQPDEFILYDFDLHVNDVFITNMGIEYTVAKIDSILLENGERRKRLEMHCPVGILTYWIEGVGSTGGTALNNIVCYTDIGSALLCIQKNNIYLFRNSEYSTCWLIILSSSKIGNTSIRYFPNPVDEILNIKDPDHQIRFLCLQNSIGLIEYTGIPQEIDMSVMSNGCYYLSILLKNGSQLVKTIIKI